MPDRPTVYIETTVVSYLTAWPDRDLIRAAQQQETREWWNTRRSLFELVCSELVIREASAGDPTAAADRLKALDGLPVLTTPTPRWLWPAGSSPSSVCHHGHTPMRCTSPLQRRAASNTC